MKSLRLLHIECENTVTKQQQTDEGFDKDPPVTGKKKSRFKKRHIEMIAYAAFGVAVGGYCYYLKGAEGFSMAIDVQVEMMAGMLPRITLAFGIAALLWVLLDAEKLKELIQKQRGVMQLVYATILGAITPGGPTSSFSILNLFLASGLGYVIGITYITAWSMLGVQRILIWDMPLLGIDQASLRFLAGFWLPSLAGLLAGWLFGKQQATSLK